MYVLKITPILNSNYHVCTKFYGSIKHCACSQPQAFAHTEASAFTLIHHLRKTCCPSNATTFVILVSFIGIYFAL